MFKIFQIAEDTEHSIKEINKEIWNLPILVAGVMHKTDPVCHAMIGGKNE